MKEAIDKVRKALSRQDIISSLTSYRFNDFTVAASDGRMTACAPIDFDLSCCVPGRELERLLDKLPSITKIEFKDDQFVVRTKGGHGTIKTTPIGDYSVITPGLEWLPVSDIFIEALETIRPFISDNATHRFSLAACLGADSMYATNNISVIKVECPNLGGKGELLPCWAIDYLLGRTDAKLNDMQFNQDYAAFRFEDDSWIRTSLINDDFPSVIPKLYQTFVEPEWPIPEEWKEIFDIVCDLSEESIQIYENKITGRRGASTVEYEIPDTPVPGGTDAFSQWSIRYLKPVIDLATHWAPQKYPNPSEFIAHGAHGFVVGRRG